MAVEVRYITDPGCVWSWAFEPVVRALMTEFGDGLEWTFVMGGLAHEYGPDDHARMVHHWLDATAESGMPTDPLAWYGSPLESTYPGCVAVKAAALQGPDAAYRYLRALREGIVCRRRRLDRRDALVEEARQAGLDVERFAGALDAPATAAAFQADMAEAQDVPDVAYDAGKVGCSQPAGRERVSFPTLRFARGGGGGGEPRWTCGNRPLGFVRDQAIAAGAEPAGGPRPTVLEALGRFGKMAPVEVAAVCDVAPDRAELELARLAVDSRARAIPVLAGRLWQLV